jgi:hypothetical protein
LRGLDDLLLDFFAEAPQLPYLTFLRCVQELLQRVNMERMPEQFDPLWAESGNLEQPPDRGGIFPCRRSRTRTAA